MKNKIVRETSARLGGLKTLGDDSEVLVLRDFPREQPEKPKKRGKLSEPIEGSPDIYAALEQEQEDITPEEVRERVEALRPETDVEPDEPQFISLVAFKKLKTDLADGFSVSQLARYYSNGKDTGHELYNRKLLESLKVEAGTSNGLQTRTEWQPGTTSIKKRLPGIHITTRTKGASVSKPLLVDRIMRSMWKIVPLEEVEAPGEIEISMKPWHLTLLTAGGMCTHYQ